MSSRNLIVAILLVFFLLGCKKEPTTWQPNIKAPLLTGQIGLSDLLTNYSIENADGYASLVFNDTAYSFRIDTLIKLPDTALVQKSAITFSQITLAPGSFINNEGIDQLYDLGDIALKRVITGGGQAFIIVSSPWPGKTKAVFEFPKIKDNNGDVFTQTYFLEAGTIDNPFVVRDTFDVTDFDFDLTGTDGSLANNLTANITMFSNEETASFNVTNLDTVLLSLTFSGLTAKYARGYFGQYDLSDTTSIDIPELKQLSGQLGLDSLKLKLNIQNGFDLTAQAKLTNLEGENSRTAQIVPLNFQLLNQFLNLNPATGGLYDYQPSDYFIEMNSNNSTIIPFIENLPDALKFGYNILINPDGNIGGGTDQFFPNSRLNIMADGELPLNILLNNFTIRDTFDLDARNIDETITEGKISLHYSNTFPLSALPTLYFLSDVGLILDSLIAPGIINAGDYDTNLEATINASSGIIDYQISKNQLANIVASNRVILSATFNTSNVAFVKINMADMINFKVISDLQLKISI